MANLVRLSVLPDSATCYMDPCPWQLILIYPLISHSSMYRNEMVMTNSWIGLQLAAGLELAAPIASPLSNCLSLFSFTYFLTSAPLKKGGKTQSGSACAPQLCECARGWGRLQRGLLPSWSMQDMIRVTSPAPPECKTSQREEEETGH